VDLWAEIKSYFLDSFTTTRMSRLGSSAETLAKLLMVVGIDLPTADMPADRALDAIRNMSPRAREAALNWLLSHIEGPKIKDPPAGAEVEQAARADRIWHEQVSPWLKRVWPKDLSIREPETSVKFALLAIATHKEFGDAVSTLLPYMCASSEWGFAISQLNDSANPDVEPKRSLDLVGRLVSVTGPLFTGDLRSVLDRISAADSSLRQEAAFRNLNAKLLALGR
jgi:hypothetical protein